MALIYARAIGSALGEGLMTAAWVASGELPARRRRLARAGAVASIIAVGVVRQSRAASPETPSPDAASPTPAEGQEREDASTPLDARRVALTLAFGGLSVGMMVGRRHLEKRWLTRLEANGHEHPYRALAIRVGLLAVATALPGKVLAAHAARHRTVDLDQG